MSKKTFIGILIAVLSALTVYIIRIGFIGDYVDTSDYIALIHFFNKDNESAKVENKTEREKEQAAIAWASKLWSQGEPDTHLSVEEITQLVDTARDTDPSIFIWMVSRSLEMIRQHRHAVKKV